MIANGDNAVKKVDVTVCDDSYETLCSGALAVTKRVTDWPADKVCFQLFKDGITNHLLKCYTAEDEDAALLVRVYGKRTELFIDRNQEVKNMQTMYEAGQCAPLYCAFNNGLCYGYSPGEVLDTELVRDPEISRLIAHRLAKMHSIKNHANGVAPDPSLFPVMCKYLHLMPTTFSDPEKNKRFQMHIPSKEQLQTELKLLREHLTNLGSPIVFCHNDLLLKNIIYNQKKEMVTFIDYEYANYNFQALDIGNHFCEFAGVDTYEPHLYPDKNFQMVWLRHYLEAWCEVNGWHKKITRSDVELLYVQVTKFSLAAHLFWGLWALIQSAHSTLDFDFLGYGKERINEYFARKEEFLSLSHDDMEQLRSSS